ncbi:hypothetical protein V500_03663 [Pseudogymnoascus sp. VKM F-4518 (FW-2643)]|nr:hypothetical protein V500_03663 [Pseudogymnoascus sp. VKM F-4518 (FW-2643)]
MDSSIKNIIVIGASGSIGPYIVSALLSNGFSVSVLTRSSSSATFPSTVTVHRTDYSAPSLLEAFKNQDVVVSTIATFSTHQQVSIIDAAISAGVKRFIPSEYGVDTSLPHIADLLPPALPKQHTIEYLRSKETSGLSWTAIIVGAFFDWPFQYPGLMGWDLAGRKAIVFDGGDVEYEATNVAQIARAVVATLSPVQFEATTNRYIYVNSFTVTQNRIVGLLEELTGAKFDVEHKTTEELGKVALEKLRAQTGFETSGDGEYPVGAVELITAAIYGYGGFNNFSNTRGLWNERLSLPEEELKTTLTRVVKELRDNWN